MTPALSRSLVSNYEGLLRRYGDSPDACQLSAEGQRFRFEKLVQIGPLSGSTVLDVGCGLGHLRDFLDHRWPALCYTGIDIVPAMIECASARRPDARFLVRDLLREPLGERFDYVLISGVFNNAAPDAARFLRELVRASYAHCTRGLGFNFISSYVNQIDEKLTYHDPSAVLRFCLEDLGGHVVLHHHYERCDVAVFCYR